MIFCDITFGDNGEEIVIGALIPYIGDTVRLPNEELGEVLSASSKGFRSWLFNQVYYEVRSLEGKRKTGWYPFSKLSVEHRAEKSTERGGFSTG